MKHITITIVIALLTVFSTQLIATASTTNAVADSIIWQNDDCKGDKDDC